jgi:hypothetical protein
MSARPPSIRASATWVFLVQPLFPRVGAARMCARELSRADVVYFGTTKSSRTAYIDSAVLTTFLACVVAGSMGADVERTITSDLVCGQRTGPRLSWLALRCNPLARGYAASASNVGAREWIAMARYVHGLGPWLLSATPSGSVWDWRCGPLPWAYAHGYCPCPPRGQFALHLDKLRD